VSHTGKLAEAGATKALPGGDDLAGVVLVDATKAMPSEIDQVAPRRFVA
jgi:hypothetical protein